MRKVSVIISTYSKSNLGFVLDCVESLKKQFLKPDETILVLDPNQELVEFYESRVPNYLRIIVSSKCGLSNARNAGVAGAIGEILAFIDDDAVAEKDWLHNLIESYGDPNVVGVGGLIKPLWEHGYPAWFPEELNWIVGCSYKGLPERKSYVRNPIGCNMSFRKAVFEKVGYFRTDVGRFGKIPLAGEEPELSMRILNTIPNAKIVYDPAAIVYHRVRQNRLRLGYLWRRSFFQGLSIALIVNQRKNSDSSSMENQYLKYLIAKAIPSRLKRVYRPKSLCQLTVLLFSAAAVFSGFAVGKSRRQS